MLGQARWDACLLAEAPRALPPRPAPLQARWMLLELGQASWDARLLAEARGAPPFTAEQLGVMQAGADTAAGAAGHRQQQGGDEPGSSSSGSLWAPTRLTDVK